MRTRRFIPLLHESIALLLPELPAPRSWYTGDVPRLAEGAADGVSAVLYPDTDGWLETETMTRLLHSGFLQWADGDGDVQSVEGVNLARRESDLSRFEEAAFRLRVTREGKSPSEEEGVVALSPEQDVVHWEYGYPILALLLVGYLLESGIALWLAQQRSGES